MCFLQEGGETSSQIDILQVSKRSCTICRRENAAVRLTFCRHQKRDHVLSAGDEECSGEIDILGTSNEIAYFLEERQEPSSQNHNLQKSKERSQTVYRR